LFCVRKTFSEHNRRELKVVGRLIGFVAGGPFRMSLGGSQVSEFGPLRCSLRNSGIVNRFLKLDARSAIQKIGETCRRFLSRGSLRNRMRNLPRDAFRSTGRSFLPPKASADGLRFHHR
jgi:hypothetical protein